MTMLAPPQHQASARTDKPARPEAIYRAIRAEPTEMALGEPFAAHVIACMLTVALVESQETGEPIALSLGLDRDALLALTTQWAPAARRFLFIEDEPPEVSLDEEEEQLHQLLARFSADTTQLGGWMASIVARRAMSPRHLWQDLGLLDRSELTRLMVEWFPTLAVTNVDNMKWKKFFYRKLCELEGFSLCAAPSCRECGDFDNCFGDEDGASVLARLSRR
ncbi:MAG: nitrogen fixation protein NifQ [Methylocystis sp.]|nr:MAG: nitrogen fixation protein NifQ [Methylocystis sp.]